MAAVALLGFAMPTAAAERLDQNDLIAVEIDQARVLKMPRPATTVIIGNPAIADVSVQDARTMVLTGRSYGITNLIVLDDKGEAIIDRHVGVQSFERGTVRIYRQAQRETVACSPQCEPVAAIGDANRDFAITAQQIQERQKLALPTTEETE